MEQLNNLDVVFLVIVGVSALVAIIRGATKELLSIIGWILAAVSVYYLLPVAGPIAKKYIASELLANLVAAMGILVVFCIFWVLTADKISSQIRKSKLSSLDRIFGFLFGILRGVLIVILLQIMISSVIPDEAEKGIFAESKFFKMAGEASGPVKALIPEKWLDEIKSKSADLGLSGKDSEESKEEEKSDETDSETENNDKMEILKKSGEKLFEELVQPKTEGNSDDKEGYQDSEMSDLDRLMDVLEDRVVTTDEAEISDDGIVLEAIEVIKENVAQ